MSDDSAPEREVLPVERSNIDWSFAQRWRPLGLAVETHEVRAVGLVDGRVASCPGNKVGSLVTIWNRDDFLAEYEPVPLHADRPKVQIAVYTSGDTIPLTNPT